MSENDKNIEIKGSIVEYFDESHTYLIDGEETLSATQITQLLNPFKIMKIPNHILKKAGERGTKIHKAIEDFLRNGSLFNKDDQHYAYFEAFLQLYADIKDELNIHKLEHIAINKEHNTPLIGTIDLFCIYKGRLAIIDWKTSSMLTLPEWRVQLSIYKELIKYTYGLEDVDLYIAWLKKDGTYQLLKIEPLPKEYMDLLFMILDNRELISRFNILLYKIYGEELIK